MKVGEKFRFDIEWMKENNISTDGKDADTIHTVLEVTHEPGLGTIIGYEPLSPNCKGYYVQINECWCIPLVKDRS